MFNEERKKGFISSYTQSEANIHQCKRFFEKTQALEQKYNIDLCEFDIEQAQEALDFTAGRQTNSQLAVITIFKAYSKWCVNQGFSGAKESISDVKEPGLDKVKRQMVSSPTHLQIVLDSVYDKEDEETTDNICRCYYWLAFSGLKPEDALKVTNDNVNLENLLIRIRDEEYPLYREALPSIKNCINLQSFRYNHPRYETPLRQPRAASNQLLRMVGVEAEFQNLRNKTSKSVRKAIKEGRTDTDLSYSRVRLSGFFYRIYELERIGIMPSFVQLTAALMDGKDYKLEKSRHTTQGTIRIINNRYKKDYERWKQAFNS